MTSVTLTGQTGPIAQTTLYTPSATGIYLVSMYLVGTTVGDGQVGPSLYWTDDAGTQNTTPGYFNLSYPGGYINFTWVVQSVASQPILYEVDTPGLSSGAYSAYLTVTVL